MIEKSRMSRESGVIESPRGRENNVYISYGHSHGHIYDTHGLPNQQTWWQQTKREYGAEIDTWSSIRPLLNVKYFAPSYRLEPKGFRVVARDDPQGPLLDGVDNIWDESTFPDSSDYEREVDEDEYEETPPWPHPDDQLYGALQIRHLDHMMSDERREGGEPAPLSKEEKQLMEQLEQKLSHRAVAVISPLDGSNKFTESMFDCVGIACFATSKENEKISFLAHVSVDHLFGGEEGERAEFENYLRAALKELHEKVLLDTAALVLIGGQTSSMSQTRYVADTQFKNQAYRDTMIFIGDIVRDELGKAYDPTIVSGPNMTSHPIHVLIDTEKRQVLIDSPEGGPGSPGRGTFFTTLDLKVAQGRLDSLSNHSKPKSTPMQSRED